MTKGVLEKGKQQRQGVSYENVCICVCVCVICLGDWAAETMSSLVLSVL